MDKFVFEAAMAASERHLRRLWVLCIILIIVLVGTNVGWIYYESQLEEVVTTQEVTQDNSDGENTFVGGDYNGEAED